jgi:general secretion pathway protein N
MAEESCMKPDRRRPLWAVALLGLGLQSVALAADQAPGNSTPANPLAAHPLEDFSETRDRPLFSPSRQPPAPKLASVPQAAPPAPPPNVVLLGVITDADGARVMVRGGDKTIRVRLGEDIEGWKVTQIESRRVVLSHDDRTASFVLFSHSKGKSTVKPEQPPAEPEVQNVAQERLDRRTGRY